MGIDRMKGQIKETTGKLMGDKRLEAEGKIEKGAAEVIKAAGNAANHVMDMAGAVINTAIGVINELYEGIKKLGRKVF